MVTWIVIAEFYCTVITSRKPTVTSLIYTS